MAFSLQQNLMPSAVLLVFSGRVGDAYRAQDEAALFRFELRDVGVTGHDTRLPNIALRLMAVAHSLHSLQLTAYSVIYNV